MIAETYALTEGERGRAGMRTHRGAKGAFRQASRALRQRVEDAAARRGFAEADVLLHWPEIAGCALADACEPVKVSYGREGGGLGATLTVRANGARAPEVELLGPTILERVNAYYGYRAIDRLRVTQTGASRSAVRPGTDRPGGFAEAPTPFAGRSAVAKGSRLRDYSYDPAALDRARDMAQDIADAGLRDALVRLGARVLARHANETKD